MNTNGQKLFLWVVRLERDGKDALYFVRSAHSPDAFELARVLQINYDPEQDTLEAQRYDWDALPTTQPKGTT